MTRSRFIVLTLLICSTLPFTLAHPLKAQPVTDFEESMRAFEELDRQNTYSPESIFFTGSSSIRMWETLERDMAPHAVIQRGFGGSRMADLLYYADRYRSEEHTSELQSRGHIVCRLLLEKKKNR